MLDSEAPTESQASDAGQTADTSSAPAKKATARKSTTKKTAAKKTAAKKTAAKTASGRTAKKASTSDLVTTDSATPDSATPDPGQPDSATTDSATTDSATTDSATTDSATTDFGQPAKATKKATTNKATAKKAPAKKTAAKKTAAKRTAAKKTTSAQAADAPAATEAEATVGALDPPADIAAPIITDATAESSAPAKSSPPVIAPLFQAPEAPAAPARRTRKAAAKPAEEPQERPPRKAKGKQDDQAEKPDAEEPTTEADTPEDESEEGDQAASRRRRRRGGRRRRKANGGGDGTDLEEAEVETDEADESTESASATRRRRRRRRAGEDSEGASDDPEQTVVRVRKARSAEDEITSVTGSTRLEAKKQRRREGREAGRRRAPIVSEAEFLARREAVDRVMVIRQRDDLTQIAVLEDKVLVEHYVARESQSSLIGNVYLGRVQNVLPSMEAAFIDIGKGRNAVLYAGEVNWDAFGAKDGQSRKIESVLKSGQSVLVQVSKDPVGHKGARLTSQISLPGRFLVYVPDGTTSGISRKLPDTERNRLKTLLKEIVPESAGVIVRTAAEGASEDELTRDVERLTARWEDIAGKVKGGSAPQLLYGEPDLTLKVVRDLFTEDFGKLVVSGDDAWDMVDGYVEHVAPDLAERLERYDGDPESGGDVFADYRIDEQIAKGLDRKVWLPSGGSLVIDRTEAMTVIDVNTGKFTGSGGNLEETVTKNNLEAAEEIVRQLRLRDIGGIIVVDFIDMVLESNRDLVMRRMIECLGRDRTRHQVAEVTSLGLVQMTRKRIGTGLLEAFSDSCETCQGRGLIMHQEPVEARKSDDDQPARRNRRSGRNRRNGDDSGGRVESRESRPSPIDVIAAASKHERHPAASSESPADAPGSATTGEAASGVAASGVAAEPSVETGDTTAPSAEAAPPAEPDAVPDQTSGSTEPATAARLTEETMTDETPADDGLTGGLKADQAAQAEPDTSAEPEPEPESPREPDLPREPDSVEATEPREPAAPKVVTVVRRRTAARRPAGPPSGSTSGSTATSDGAGSHHVGTPAASTYSQPEVPIELHEREPVAQAHVPIKKKGSRKR